MRQAISAAEAGHGRDCTSWLYNPGLFAQTPRGITQDSEYRVTGCQIERAIWQGHLVGITFSKFDAIAEPLHFQLLAAERQQFVVTVNPYYLNVLDILGY